MAKKNYLNNKDILKQIHKSKMTYCFVENENAYDYDLILDNVNEIDKKAIEKAKVNKAARMQAQSYQAAMAMHDPKNYRNKPKQKDFAVDVDTLDEKELVFRVMTYEHIPLEPGRKKNPKTEADEKARVNFPPFKHYVLNGKKPREVARSHWKGDLTEGEFSVDNGRITAELGRMFLKLVERYSYRSNWRGYSYVDEMRGQALLQLSSIGLLFNEQRSDNPFAYYTAALTNSFTRVLNMEKRNQGIRDDILQEQGHMPSYTRQLEHEQAMQEIRDARSDDAVIKSELGFSRIGSDNV